MTTIRVELEILTQWASVWVPADLTQAHLDGKACLICGTGAELHTGHDLSAIPIAYAHLADGIVSLSLYAHPGTDSADVLYSSVVARCEACGEVDPNAVPGDRRCQQCREADALWALKGEGL